MKTSAVHSACILKRLCPQKFCFILKYCYQNTCKFFFFTLKNILYMSLSFSLKWKCQYISTGHVSSWNKAFSSPILIVELISVVLSVFWSRALTYIKSDIESNLSRRADQWEASTEDAPSRDWTIEDGLRLFTKLHAATTKKGSEPEIVQN